MLPLIVLMVISKFDTRTGVFFIFGHRLSIRAFSWPDLDQHEIKSGVA